MSDQTPRGDAPRPTTTGERSLRWIDGSEGLAGLLAEVGSGPLAADTEADSYYRYRERVCLIQLSFGATDALVDPLEGIDLAPLARALGDPLLPKILHGADYDVRLLARDEGILVRGLFDTMIAARLVGERAFGLASLLQKHLDVRLDKRFQRADWARRPLPPDMLRYAVDDTRYLLPLAELLRDRLERLGRVEWAAEEFRHVESARWTTDEGGVEPWRRVKRQRGVPRSRLGVLRELAELRDRQARQRNVPPFRVLRDDVLVELARQAPEDVGGLASIRGLPAAWRDSIRTARLLEAVARGLAADPADWPELPAPSRRRVRGAEQEARLGRLLCERDRVAQDLDLEPSVVASRPQLESLADALVEGRAPEPVIELRDWQRALLVGALSDV